MKNTPRIKKLSNETINDLVMDNIYPWPLDFSTSLDDAMYVVGKLEGTQRAIVGARKKYYCWSGYYRGVKGEATEPTLPRAICVAALRAYGVLPGGKDFIGPNLRKKIKDRK